MTTTLDQHLSTSYVTGAPIVSMPRAMITSYTPAVPSAGAATRAALASQCSFRGMSLLGATHIVSSAFALQLVVADEADEDL
jgi:hypothetical protein